MLTNITVSILTHMFMKVLSMLWEAVNPSSMIVYTCIKGHLFKLPMNPFSLKKKKNNAFRSHLLRTFELFPYTYFY